ncbi:MAG TPA: hypothetical protein VF596_04105 [Pyrinomonadaceae bacterium]|jgi:hypothetical protein
MKITKNAFGWTVEPSTSDEQKHLGFLFKALEEVYGRASATEDSSQATQSRTLDDNPSSVLTE